MSELPESWVQVPLAAITREVTQRVPSDEETIRYIDIGSVNRTTKAIDAPQELLGKDAPSRARKQVAAGDTLVSMTRPNLNAIALVPQELDGEIASTGFDVLRPVPDVDPRWISYLVRTEKFVYSMSALVQGALYPTVRSKDVRAHVVPLAPAAEQTRIANQLDTLLTRIQSCNDRFDAIPALLKRFRQAVLSAGTTGALTADWRGADSTESWDTCTIGQVLNDKPRNGYSPQAAGYETPTEIFGMPTSLDIDTQRLIDERNALAQRADKSDKDEQRLIELNDDLARRGFLYEDREPLYQDFLRAWHDVRYADQPPLTPEEIQQRHASMKALIKKLSGERAES